VQSGFPVPFFGIMWINPSHRSIVPGRVDIDTRSIKMNRDDSIAFVKFYKYFYYKMMRLSTHFTGMYRRYSAEWNYFRAN
jgi:hypothetical protein